MAFGPRSGRQVNVDFWWWLLARGSSIIGLSRLLGRQAARHRRCRAPRAATEETMNATQLGILALVRAAITNKKQQLPEGFHIEEAYSEISRHNLLPLCYAGGVICGIDKNNSAMQRMFMIYVKQMVASEKQMAEVARVCAAFDAAGIDHMPLKGSTLKSLYPKPEFRLMGDADILIREEQYGKIAPVMTALGFKFKQESDHELAWQSDSLYLELHKHLIPSYNKDYYSYYQDGWQLAKLSTNSRHEFKSNEDEFIFIFTHFAKHYRDGGIGIRQVIDLWVYRNSYPDMDDDYIRGVLEKLQLFDFYENILSLIAVWFENAEPTDMTEFISAFIFTSGNWGNIKSKTKANAVKHKQISEASSYSLSRNILRRTFPAPRDLIARYPVLKRHPWLVPVFWVHRIFDAIINKRNRVKIYVKVYNSTDEIETYEQSLDYVGLRFNFKK